MPRMINRLTDRFVKTAKQPGKYSDGGGLVLWVRSATSKSWFHRSNKNGVRRERGLGSALTVSLAEARKKAREAKEEASVVKVPTFGEFATEQIEIWRRQGHWRAHRTPEQWHTSLRLHAKPILNMRIDQISEAACPCLCRADLGDQARDCQ